MPETDHKQTQSCAGNYRSWEAVEEKLNLQVHHVCPSLSRSLSRAIRRVQQRSTSRQTEISGFAGNWPGKFQEYCITACSSMEALGSLVNGWMLQQTNSTFFCRHEVGIRAICIQAPWSDLDMVDPLRSWGAPKLCSSGLKGSYRTKTAEERKPCSQGTGHMLPRKEAGLQTVIPADLC